MLSFMSNTSLAIKLQPAERTQVEKWESSHGTPQQVAMRCRIILRALAGQQNVAIAEELGVSRPTVLLWRKRVREQGIGDIAPAAVGVSRTTIKPGETGSLMRRCGAAHGQNPLSCRLMAEAQEVSKNTVNRLGNCTISSRT
jgi:DNA-binding XRE family transcriptional regulator